MKHRLEMAMNRDGMHKSLTQRAPEGWTPDDTNDVRDILARQQELTVEPPWQDSA
jgi:hypothetical protein